MRRLMLFAGLVGTLSLVAARQPMNHAAELPCQAPGTIDAAMIQTIKELLVETDSSAVRWRNGFGVAGVDSATVAVVADTLVCTRVTRVIDSVSLRAPSTRAFLVVLRIGARYVAFAPLGNGALYFLDTNFVFKDLAVSGH